MVALETNRDHSVVFETASKYCILDSLVVDKGYLLRLVHPFGRIQLVFALLHFVLQGQTCLLFQVYLDFILLHSNPQ